MKLIRYQYPQPSTYSSLSQLFDFGAPAFGRFGSAFEDLFSVTPSGSSALADLYEDDSNYFVQVELPGLNSSDVEVEFEDQTLTIRSASGSEDQSKEERFQFERSIKFPEGVDRNQVSASLVDGILKVVLPKVEIEQPRRIELS